MTACRHLDENAHNGRWTRCGLCREIIPWGPATMTPQVELEVLAAEVAAGSDSSPSQILASARVVAVQRGLGGGAYQALHCGAALIDGTEWLMDEPYCWTEVDLDHYAAGALAREIVEHEEQS
jgi:hypothetical protein